jgi:hypothetical protein
LHGGRPSTTTITLATFLVTVAVIVPAGWHAVGADIQTDGKRLRPLQESFVVDGTRVTLDVDRHVVMTGDTVKATLVAFSDTPKQIAVDLIALSSSNYEGSRVETPWIPIDHETIKLTAGPHGGKPVDTAIKLGEMPDRPALVDEFKIYITPHGKKPPRSEGEDRIDYVTGVSEGYAAAISITGWSGDNLKMAIEPEGRPTSDAPFTIAVRVKNTTGQSLAHAPDVSLSTEAALEGTEAASYEDAAVAIEKIETDVRCTTATRGSRTSCSKAATSPRRRAGCSPTRTWSRATSAAAPRIARRSRPSCIAGSARSWCGWGTPSETSRATTS